jgi:predicted amidophosphoribosyltransferase
MRVKCADTRCQQHGAAEDEMPVIACKDCGQPVSPKAAACPKCGRPLERAVMLNGLYSCLGPVVFVAMVVGVFWALGVFR